MNQRKSTIQILFYCLLLILVPASAYALNLGEINLKSAPGEPLEAEIQLLGVAPDEQDSLTVGLADVAGFRWAGIQWSPVLNQLQFELKRGADDMDYIRILSSEVVQAQRLHFLLKVAWSRGRLFREYTLELGTPPYVSGEQPGQAVSQPAAVPAAERDWDKVRAAVGAARNYGPVVRFDTLWSLARELRPDASVSIQQMMLALLRTNPDAFSYGNINRLKEGAVLWMPNNFELKALSGSEAYAEVLAQNNVWREARGYASIDTGLPTEPATVAVDGGLRLVAVAEEDREDNGAAAVDPDGTARAEALALANEQVEGLSQEKIDLEDKLSESETIIKDLRRLVELKDDELAALQGQELSEQAEPGPGLVERLESFHDSTIEPTYNLARDNWRVALACLVALLLAGWWLLRRKSANAVGGLTIPAATIRPDFVKVTRGEKAAPPEEIIEREDDFANEIEAEEEESRDETEAALDDNQEDGGQGEDDEEDMVQNKLELARAYLELGDAENVRSILHEVLSEGNAAQREKARQLLEQTASE